MFLVQAGGSTAPWCPWCGSMMGGGGMMGYWAMGVWMLLGFLIAIAVLVLLILAIVRLWPGRETFSSAEPLARRSDRPREEDDHQ